jgi:hypothetical protein
MIRSTMCGRRLQKMILTHSELVDIIKTGSAETLTALHLTDLPNQ